MACSKYQYHVTFGHSSKIIDVHVEGDAVGWDEVKSAAKEKFGIADEYDVIIQVFQSGWVDDFVYVELDGEVPPKAKLKMLLNSTKKLPVIIDAILNSEDKELKSSDIGDSSLCDDGDDLNLNSSEVGDGGPCEDLKMNSSQDGDNSLSEPAHEGEVKSSPKER